VPAPGEGDPDSFQAAREEYERRLLAAALEQTGGNLTEASRLLRISRNTLKSNQPQHPEVGMRRYGL
jgi:DNA-binding NtrC family response regulator